ncbi:MAG: hypothetical protein IJS78_03350 [Clostridia bacterium]|nr:hypothetical protein [Clostridia bacterium]
MKILFAAPDRDLLGCYKELLDADLGETVAAFDGTQALSALFSESFDIVIVDRGIPRVDYRKIIERAHGKSVPVIVLTDAPVGSRRLTEEPLPNEWLSYPFTPGRVADAVRDTLEKASSAERMELGDVGIDVPGFRIEGGPRLTLREINVLLSLLNGGRVTTDDGACVCALNDKLGRIGSRTRIRYRAGKGFETVTENE